MGSPNSQQRSQRRIPVSELVHGGLYKLDAKHLKYGVYASDRKAFIGVRLKFGTPYLDTEVDWELGGTALPVEFVSLCPLDGDKIYERRQSRDEGELTFPENGELRRWIRREVERIGS